MHDALRRPLGRVFGEGSCLVLPGHGVARIGMGVAVNLRIPRVCAVSGPAVAATEGRPVECGPGEPAIGAWWEIGRPAVESSGGVRDPRPTSSTVKPKVIPVLSLREPG